MIAALSTPAALAAQAMGHGWGPGPWFLIFPLFWLVVIGLFIFFVPRRLRRSREWHHSQGAESVLHERYARGEVDETEYRQRLEVLRSQGGS
jgi:putative membrane protein